MNAKSSIGASLRRAREEAKLTQRQVSQRSGMTPEYLCALEQDKHSPTMETVARTVDAIGATLLLRFDPGEAPVVTAEPAPLRRKPPSKAISDRDTVRAMKAALAQQIVAEIDTRNLTLESASRQTAIGKAVFTRIRRGNLSALTLDRLIEILLSVAPEANVSLNVTSPTADLVEQRQAEDGRT